MVGSLLLALAASWQAEPHVHPQDPLHRHVALEVDAEGATVSWRTDFEGTLHVWASAAEIDPRLEVYTWDRDEPLEDDDSGGGTTAWLSLTVTAGQELAFLALPAGSGTGSVELHWIAAPETEATRAAASAGRSALAGIERLERTGDLDEARRRVSARIAELRAVDGARSSERIADTLWAAGRLAQRLSSLRAQALAWGAAHAHRERVLPPDHPDLLAAEQNLALTREQLGDLDGALELLEHVHAARERLLAPDHSDLLRAKTNLALTRKALGDLDGAHELFEAVHAAWARLLPPDHADLLRAEQNLAATRKQLGDLAGALELEEHVHAVREQHLPPDHPDLLGAKNNLALTRSALGDLTGALEILEGVHAALERLLPPDHPDRLAAKLNLAATRNALGDLAGAHELEKRVHAALERLLPPDHPDRLAVELNLAVTRRKLGDLEGALELEEHVHAARERLLLPDHPDLLAAKLNLAVTRIALGDVDGAHELEEHVHAARERLLPPDHPDLLSARLNLALTRGKLGDLDGALELLEQVYATRAELLPPDHPALLRTAQNLAATRERRFRERPPHAAEREPAATPEQLVDPAGALELFEHVHAALERLLPADHTDLLAAKLHLARTRTRLGDLEGACEMSRSLLASQLAVVDRLRVSAPRVARAAAAGELRRLSEILSLARPTGSEAPESERLLPRIFSVVESLRAVSTASGDAARAAQRFAELAELRSEQTVLGAELSSLTLAAPREEAAVEAWRRRVVELSEERDRVQRALLQGLAERGIVWTTPTLEAVARGLAADAALVSFLRYERSPAPGAGGEPTAVDSLLAFVVTPEATIERVELGPAAPLEELVERWRARIGQPVQRGVGVLDSDADEPVDRRLRDALLAPCLERLGERPATLHVVLDDFLHLVPLDALPGSGEGRLGDELDLRVETSVARLVRTPRPVTGERRLVALGGIDFDAELELDAPEPERPQPDLLAATPPVGGSVSRAGAPERFGGLLQTRLEVETLELLCAELAGGEFVALTGAAATKDALFAAAPGARWLHLATHGWFAPDTVTSTLDVAEGHDALEPALSRAERTVQGFAPQTLCGLALAGANHGMNALGKVPGIVTAEELATLDLSDCELAVLSACETNVGLRRAGQGIQSLQTALHAAGARTAITSLWRVDDAATRRLFEVFYTKLWTERTGKADALWQAKAALRAEGHPPRDWAGWVLTGDPD